MGQWHGIPGETTEILLDLTNKVLEEKNKLALDLTADEQSSMVNLIRVGFSAGCQRHKVIIGYNPETKEIRSGQVPLPEGFLYYLLKFDGVVSRWQHFARETGVQKDMTEAARLSHRLKL